MADAERLVQHLLSRGHSAPLTVGLLLTNASAQAAALEWIIRRLSPFLFADQAEAVALLQEGDATERLRQATSLLGRAGLVVPKGCLASADGLFADLLALLEGAETVVDGLDAQYDKDMHLAKAIEEHAGTVFSTHVHTPGVPMAKPRPAAPQAPPAPKRPKVECARCPTPEALSAEVTALRREVNELQATVQQKAGQRGVSDTLDVDIPAVRARWMRLKDLHTAALAATKAFSTFVDADVPTSTEREGPLGFPLGIACGDAFARRSEVWQMLTAFRALQESYQQLCAQTPAAVPGDLTGDHIFALTSTLQTLEEAIQRRRNCSSPMDCTKWDEPLGLSVAPLTRL
eukprot:GGOE01036922.1.p1 GENE.GGOE01036922.1~~GGOE01036922.1.p1  ORF type:complete len:365 (+),score=103.99 GGOE01036922.1:60-1097(+)